MPLQGVVFTQQLSPHRIRTLGFQWGPLQGVVFTQQLSPRAGSFAR
jgi:hypothetical protein